MAELSKTQEINNNNSLKRNLNNVDIISLSNNEEAVAAAVKTKMKSIQNDLIGGERANDEQLREKHKKKKIAAQRRMRSDLIIIHFLQEQKDHKYITIFSALAEALNRVEQSEDRSILQGHYSDIQHELQVKTDALKSQKHKVSLPFTLFKSHNSLTLRRI